MVNVDLPISLEPINQGLWLTAGFYATPPDQICITAKVKVMDQPPSPTLHWLPFCAQDMGSGFQSIPSCCL
jgi:hypothetical protein